MNIPNMLTIFRLFLIPIFAFVFFSNAKSNLVYSIFIFLIAGLTDILDGYIARKYNLITKFGTVLDPLADKLMLITVLSCLVIRDYIPLWILLIVGAKEFSLILSGIILYKKSIVIPSNWIGKTSTLFFYISILILSVNISIGKYLLYISVLSAILAFSYYLIHYASLRHNSKSKTLKI